MTKLLALALSLNLLSVSGIAVELPAVTAASPAAAPASAAQRFADLARDYWDTQLRLSPITATFVGDTRYNDKLDDIGASGRAEERREMGRILGELSKIDRSALGPSERISYDVMRLQVERDLDAQRYDLWQWNVDHMDGPQSWIPTVVATTQPMASEADAEALLLRMKALPAYFASYEGNLREGLQGGRMAAKVPVEKTIRQLQSMIEAPANQSPFAQAGQKLPENLRQAYAPKIAAALDTHVKPAYGELLRFLKEEYLPRARSGANIGLSGLPDGRQAYLFQIRYHTTLDKTPEELHQIGLDELRSIHDEMAGIAKKMGFTGNVPSFLDKVRKDPKNFFNTREEVLQTAQEIVDRAKSRLPLFFSALPRTPVVVKPVEAYKEKNEVAAYYFEPADDLSRPGIYYINTYQPQSRPRFGMYSLAAHEGVPGHHLQIALAMENRDLPTFRRHGEFNAFVEGWALYCERLAAEMGLYPDDLSRLGMLSDQALRASRLVVDTGIHAMNWSRQQAIDFMKDNTAMSQEEIEAEVDRYTVWPGQALSYKVGQREIAALRQESEKGLGPKFDIKRFHDAVLRNGALPLPVLRAVIKAEDDKIAGKDQP